MSKDYASEVTMCSEEVENCFYTENGYIGIGVGMRRSCFAQQRSNWTSFSSVQRQKFGWAHAREIGTWLYERVINPATRVAQA